MAPLPVKGLNNEVNMGGPYEYLNLTQLFKFSQLDRITREKEYP